MKITCMIPTQTRSQIAYYDRTEKGTMRMLRGMPAAAFFLLFILSRLMMPSAAESASWKDSWNIIKKQGEQVYKDTIEVITPPAEKQPDQPQKPTAEPQPSYSKGQVRQIQGLLRKLGYDPGAVDGIYGKTTAAAIEAYQADHNLLRTGKPSEALIAHMQKTLSGQPPAATSKAPSGGAPPPVKKTGGTTQEIPSREAARATAEFGEDILALTPEGIYIGMELSAAKAVLEENGFRAYSPGGSYTQCHYLKGVKGLDASTTELALTTDINGNTCLEGEPVRRIGINYYFKDWTGISPLDLVERLENGLGAPAKCQDRSKNKIKGCQWDFPPRAPLVMQVRLHGGLLTDTQLVPSGNRIIISESTPELSLSLSLLAKPDVKLPEQPPAFSSDDSSQPRSAVAGPNIVSAPVGVKTDSIPSEGRNLPSAGKSKFEIEGISLGMSSEQIKGILMEKGYTLQGNAFRKGPAKKIGSRIIGVRNPYRGSEDKGISRITLRILSQAEGINEEIEKFYQSIAARYGVPDQCRDSSHPNERCEWTNDQGEKLLLQRRFSDEIIMVLDKGGNK